MAQFASAFDESVQRNGGRWESPGGTEDGVDREAEMCKQKHGAVENNGIMLISLVDGAQTCAENEHERQNHHQCGVESAPLCACVRSQSGCGASEKFRCLQVQRAVRAAPNVGSESVFTVPYIMLIIAGWRLLASNKCDSSCRRSECMQPQ